MENNSEVKLNVEGFDRVPILIGTEQSDGVTSLEKLCEFQNCKLNVKSVNVKKGEGEVLEVKTYYTVAEAKEKQYNNEIVNFIERKDSSNMTVEVCLGDLDNKRYLKIEYPSTLNFLEMSKRIHLDVYKELAKVGNNEDKVNLVLYDKDGFEKNYEVTASDILKYIVSVRIIEINNQKISETISKKARDAFSIFKEDGKNKIESISNIKDSIVKMLTLKKA